MDQGNSIWPGPCGQQSGGTMSCQQPCWPCQPNQPQPSWPGSQPSAPNQPSWPVAQPSAPNQPNWPVAQPSAPNQPNWPVAQPSQPNQPGWPGPQPSQPNWPAPSQPSQPNPPNWPVQPQPSQPNWPAPQPTQSGQPGCVPGGCPVPSSGWPVNPGQPGWPGQMPSRPPQWPVTPSGPATVPYNQSFPRGIYDKFMLTIRGQVKPNAKMFTVNLLRGADIALHINPRFGEKQMGGREVSVVVRNNKVGERWGKEERNIQGQFPFAPGQPFEMRILCTFNEFKVAVNNAQLFEFKHRIRELNQIDRINILHDVNLTSVNVDTLA